MRALVLGATGHIGAHIVRALLTEGHQVRAAYRSPRFLGVLGTLPLERVRVDLDTGDGLAAAAAGCDWVFHAAGYYPRSREPRKRAISLGLAATRRTLEALQRARPSRIVFTSSASTLRRIPGRPATEDDPEPWPLHGWRPLYATVKIAMEHEVLSACRGGAPVVIVNPSLCIGEYDAHTFSGRAILAFAKHRLPFYLDHRLNAVYTGDVGIGHVRAAERGRAGERYLLTREAIGLREFAGLVARAAGVPAPTIRVPYPLAMAAATASEALAWLMRSEPLVPRQVIYSARRAQELDGTKALRELGLPQTPLEEAIKRALAWFSEQGFL